MDSSGSASQTPEPSRPARLHGSACDTCRRRRVKCGGGQPCERCARSNVSCTYGSVASRSSAVSYARHLEQKVAELQQMQGRFETPIDERAALVSSTKETTQQQMVGMLIGPEDDYIVKEPESSTNIFYGRFAGFRMLQKIGDMTVPSSSEAVQTTSHGRKLVEAFEMPVVSSTIATESKLLALLPSKQQVYDHVVHSMRTALTCHDCLDQAQFFQQLDNLYEVSIDDYTLDHKRFLSLVYALMALSKRFSPMTIEDQIDDAGKVDQLKGMTYLNVSCELLYTTDFCGLDFIRAVICQARYFLSASMVSRAHSHVGMGIAAALRMGLHTSNPVVRSCFSDEEAYQRRKVFATLNMMDTYLASLLGIPKTLQTIASDQTLGVRDEDLADEGLAAIRQNPTETWTETILCQKLNLILAKIIESRASTPNGAISAVTEKHSEWYELVSMREAEMLEWHNTLPAMIEGTADTRVLQAQLTLRLWYSCAQIILYRPFLHHLTRDRNDPQFDIRGYEFGSACVRAAMQGLWVIEAFQTNNLIHEAYWLVLYMLGFTASILSFFVVSSPHRTTIEESSAAIWKARDILNVLRRYSFAAKQCSDTLNALLDGMSETSAFVS